MRISMCSLVTYHQDNTDRTCTMRMERVHAGFRWESIQEGDQVEDPCVDGGIVLTL
jgi:hypothetical protein